MIKLKKDPKVENFTIENIILKDSIIINNDWVLGIILFRPEESLFSMNQQRKYMNNTHHYYTKLINSFLFVWTFQILSLILVKKLIHFI